MKIKRIVYFAYYIKTLNHSRVNEFIRYINANESDNPSHSKIVVRSKIWADILLSSIKYNISILDYFYFRFYKNESHAYRNSFAGTGHLYEYQLEMNPKSTRSILENKIIFLKLYAPFINRKHTTINELLEIGDKQNILKNKSGKIVIKGSKGQVGAEVEVLKVNQFAYTNLLAYMKLNRFDLLEEYVVQHHTLMSLSPSGLNTIRIFTQLEGDQCIFLGARLRISINSPVDNMAAGNIACSVDINTGIVNGPGVFSDICKEDVFIHPVTGIHIIGFKVPHWSATLELVKRAAFLYPENRSIGWDIAITDDGPELIEGNHNWCKLLWQLPVKAGLKSLLTPSD